MNTLPKCTCDLRNTSGNWHRLTCAVVKAWRKESRIGWWHKRKATK